LYVESIDNSSSVQGGETLGPERKTLLPHSTFRAG
jgi:hypothetical protein